MTNGKGNGGDQELQPRPNEGAPIRSAGQLSPPIVREPIHECARAVHVEGFIPHAQVVVYANGVEVVGQRRPYVGFDDIPLTRPLSAGDQITATQAAFGLTSAHSQHAVTVDQPVPLAKPSVGPTIYACGQVVLVGGLTPSTHVAVYSASTPDVQVNSAQLIGEAECTGAGVAVVTQPLNEGWFVAAQQVACPGTGHELVSARSDAVRVPPEPQPVNPPKLDTPVIGNDAASLENLYIGARVSVTDVTSGAGVGGGLANAGSDWAKVQPPIKGGDKYAASQTLCTPSVASPPVTATSGLPAPVLVSPICPDDRTVVIRGTIINATVALYRVGSSLPIGIGGAVPGDLELAIGSAFSLGVNDGLYVRQFMGNTISAESNHVSVTDCRNVITQHNDISRTGAYLHETRLTAASVGGSGFGRLYEREVDGSPYAQILFVRDVVNTPMGTRNLFIVATSTNMVYAFDADDQTPGTNAGLVWKTSLGPTRSLNWNEICRETYGTVGITATPVIDVAAQTIYVVARVWPGDTTPTPPGNVQLDGDNYLHALKLSDGTDRLAPTKIEGTDPRTGNVFDPKVHRNRPGLLLLNGAVYIGFGTFSCDGGPYHGWVFGYDAATLRPTAIFCTTRNLHGGGIWQSGNGLVGADDGSVYFETGNEIGDGAGPPANFGDCFVRLTVEGEWPGLLESGYFRPGDWKVLRDGDTDLGSGGPVLLPGGLLVGGGKQGRYYVLNATTMHLTQDVTSPDLARVGEGFQAFFNEDRNVAQDAADHYAVYATGELFGPNIHGGPIYWRGPSRLYQMPEKDFLKAFQYDRLSGTVLQSPVATSTVRPGPGMPGGHSSISANGDRDGIVWTCIPIHDGQWVPTLGTLAAFDALSLKEIWADRMPEWFAKFNPPTIADGKVFRPVFAQYQVANPDDGAAPSMLTPGKVIVYGLQGLHRHPQPVRPQWRRWLGGEDPAPRFTIEQRWRMHGGAGVLTEPVGTEEDLRDAHGGRRRDFAGSLNARRARVSVRTEGHDPTCHRPLRQSIQVSASMYWSPGTGAYVVIGEIRDEYLRRGAHESELGYPLSDERDTPDRLGRVTYFEHGCIYWYPETGAEARLNEV
jgi:hypothetical protein